MIVTKDIVHSWAWYLFPPYLLTTYFFVLSNLYTKQIFQQETQDDVDTGQVNSWKIIALTSFSIPFDCILSRNRINFKGPVSWGLFDFFRQNFLNVCLTTLVCMLDHQTVRLTCTK